MPPILHDTDSDAPPVLAGTKSWPGAVQELQRGREIRILRLPSPSLKIAVTTAYGYWGDVSPRDIFAPGSPRMLGGGETSMFWLARGLAEAGHRVDLFYDTKRAGTEYGVNCYPKSMKDAMLTTTDYDVLLSWEDVEAVKINHRAKKVIYAVQCNSMQIGVLDYGIDAYQAVSNWHVNTMMASDPSALPRVRDKWFVFPNGVDLARYRQPVEREPYRVIHSSSPDRGLHHLLALWPRVKRQVPQASLHIYYDMQTWFDVVDRTTAQGMPTNTTERANLLRALLKQTEDLDVTVHGGIGQWELAQEQMKASLCVYPCDPIQPTEGFSCTVLECLAAGTPVVTSDADAFPELWSGKVSMQGLPFAETHDEWLRAIVHLLAHPYNDEWEYRSRTGKQYAEGFDWRLLGGIYAGTVQGIATGEVS